MTSFFAKYSLTPTFIHRTYEMHSQFKMEWAYPKIQFDSDEYHCKPNTNYNCLKAQGGLEKVAGKNWGLSINKELLLSNKNSVSICIRLWNNHHQKKPHLGQEYCACSKGLLLNGQQVFKQSIGAASLLSFLDQSQEKPCSTSYT